MDGKALLRVEHEADLGGAGAAGPPGPAPHPGRPPCSNRGGETSREGGEGGPEGLGGLISAAVDYLTVTVGGSGDPESVGAFLMAWSAFSEPGKAQPGFRESEERMVLGGYGWRRWDPRQPCKLFGDRYESWQFPGITAAPAANALRGRRPIKPSRIDVAFDLHCDQDMTPERLVAWMRPKFAARGVTDGLVGHDGVFTCYIFAKGASRRIRIYRKDLQDPAYAEWLRTPVMRVEVILTDERAVEWWDLWDRDSAAAKLAASSFLHDYTGLRPLPGDHDWPELVLPEGADVAGQMALWVEQHGPQLSAWAAAGVDVGGLVREFASKPRNRVAACRMRKRVREVRRVGAGVVEAMVRDILGRRGGLASVEA